MIQNWIDAVFFSVTLRDGNIQEFDTRWDEALSSMSKKASDDVLERLYELRIRESDQLESCIYNCVRWRFIRRCPIIKMLKTMVKRRTD